MMTMTIVTRMIIIIGAMAVWIVEAATVRTMMRKIVTM